MQPLVFGRKQFGRGNGKTIQEKQGKDKCEKPLRGRKSDTAGAAFC